jgi:hypothetical protein
LPHERGAAFSLACVAVQSTAFGFAAAALTRRSASSPAG